MMSNLEKEAETCILTVRRKLDLTRASVNGNLDLIDGLMMMMAVLRAMQCFDADKDRDGQSKGVLNVVWSASNRMASTQYSEE